MTRTFIATLGFDEKFVVRGLLRHGFTKNDQLILVTSSPLDERVEKAYQYIKDFLSKHEVKPQIVEINTLDFNKALIQLKGLLTTINTTELIVNLSGGMRALILEVLVALLYSGILEHTKLIVEVELENFTSTVTIPLSVLKALTTYKLSETKKQILKALIKHRELSIQELCNLLSKDESVISRHLSNLQKLNFIDVEHRRKVKVAKATFLAELII